MSFLTLEDVNSVLYRNQGFYWHEIDTSKLPEGDFTDVKYDCFEITRTQSASKNIYTVKVHSSLWTKGVRGVYVGATQGVAGTNITSTGFTMAEEFSVQHSNFKIYVYMGVLEVQGTILGYLVTDALSLNLKQLNTQQNIKYRQWGRDNTYTSLESVSVGYNEIIVTGWSFGYLLVNLVKTDFQFTCNQSLTVGKVNKVYLGANADYKPSGDLVGTYTPTITVDYNGETLPVSYDGTDYYFNLDLTNVTETGKIRFKVNVEANEVLNSTETLVKLTSNYPTISTFDALQSACNSNGIIRLGANITFTNRISITNSIKIIGNEKVLDLDGYGFDLKEDKQLTIENVSLTNGDTAIKQSKNSKLELTNVSFTGCQSSNHSNLGACILCDIDYQSLSVTDDFQTELTNCLFSNNHSTILHGGELNINNCKFHNTNTDYVDKSNTAFIYQVDGDCTILNSIFDIDYGTDYSLCTGETNIGYSQTIFMIGETATINGLTYLDLPQNNLNTFFETLQNNRSHIYAKYYYPQIETCVFVSPTPNMEDKSFCYSRSGDDMIYKVNTQVTRASANTENNRRVITW